MEVEKRVIPWWAKIVLWIVLALLILSMLLAFLAQQTISSGMVVV